MPRPARVRCLASSRRRTGGQRHSGRCSSKKRLHTGEMNVGTWMPFVTYPIGFSSGGISRQCSAQQLRRDRAVDAADSVHATRAVQREPRHVEAAGLVRGAAERQQLLGGQTHRAREADEMLEEEAIGKRVVAGGHGVCVVNTLCAATASSRGVEREPARELVAKPLEHEERGMAFVHVPDRGAACPAPSAHARRRCRAPSPGGCARARRRRRAGSVMSRSSAELSGQLVSSR